MTNATRVQRTRPRIAPVSRTAYGRERMPAPTAQLARLLAEVNTDAPRGARAGPGAGADETEIPSRRSSASVIVSPGLEGLRPPRPGGRSTRPKDQSARRTRQAHRARKGRAPGVSRAARVWRAMATLPQTRRKRSPFAPVPLDLALLRRREDGRERAEGEESERAEDESIASGHPRPRRAPAK